MMILISFHSIDSYSALHHKCAWFQDFADMFSTCNLWLRKYGVAWRGHNVNKLFIENMFDFFKSTIGIFGKKLYSSDVHSDATWNGWKRIYQFGGFFEIQTFRDKQLLLLRF